MKKFLAAIIGASLIFGGCGGNSGDYYSNGQFEVGVDIPAGEYIAVGRGDLDVRTSKAIDASNLIANPFVRNRQYLDVHDGEFVSVGGVDLKLYPSAKAPKIDTGGKLSEGQYKVGVDIPAGEYKISGECQKEWTTRTKLFDTSGTTERGLVTVVDGQYLKICSGEGEFVRDLASVLAGKKPVNLGLTFAEFKAAYNAKIQEIAPQTNWNVSAMELIQTGDEVQFEFKLEESVTLRGRLENLTGKVSEVAIISTPKTAEEAGAALLAYALVAATLNPELTAQQRGELFAELKLVGESITELKNGGANATRGAVKYLTSYDAANGKFYFTASA